MQPTSVELAPPDVLITWNDGHHSRLSMARLRKECPCATCRTEREKIEAPSKKGLQLRVLSDRTPAVAVAQAVEWHPIGRYALGFKFNDGHATGIYAYDFLRSRCECEQCLPKG